MTKRMLPMNALPGFDAAARRLSFTLAAKELNITQGAISRQIRGLERSVGTPLFRRKTRRVELTEAGEELFCAVQEALNSLDDVTARLRGANAQALVVSVLPTLATAWLMPKLHRFAEQHSALEVRIVASIDPAQLEGSGVDVAIRVGQVPGQKLYDRLQPRTSLSMTHGWRGVHAEELFPDVLVPVCSSALLEGQPLITFPSDLLLYPLIHNSTRRNAWPDWLKAHRVPQQGRTEKDMEFGHFFMALDAAARGNGIALIPSILLLDNPIASMLVAPMKDRVSSAGEYHLLVHESRLRSASVQAFRAWIRSEALEARQRLVDSET